MNSSKNPKKMRNSLIPPIIDGVDVTAVSDERTFEANKFVGWSGVSPIRIQGADITTAIRAADSCAAAFPKWRQTPAAEKRRLLQRVADLLQEQGETIRKLLEKEINCSKKWSQINLDDTIDLVREAASLCTSNILNGTIPLTRDAGSHTLILTEPLGVVLGIAPWNAPLILGMRAVVAPIAAGNTAVLKDSELSPQTHYFIANLFQEAGFPPGVLNFILHRPEDAAEIFDAMITHPAVRKCNFTGSTPVGRAIASRAAAALKPVLLELGGKNFAIVLQDADLDKAARLIIEGATLNNGQICMSTDTVLVNRAIFEPLKEKLLSNLTEAAHEVRAVITSKSTSRLQSLVEDARTKGASIIISGHEEQGVVPATLVEGLDSTMDLYRSESFGPLLGVLLFNDDAEAVATVNESSFGLSSAIFTRNHFRALGMARELRVGAVHINGMTVHDEPTLPHGGHGDSGWGRFGGAWGIAEFLHTKNVILNE